MIRLMIADDHLIVREGLKRLLGECSDVSVVAEASNGNAVLEMVATTSVDVVLLDVSMPGPGFLNVLRALREGPRPPSVIVLSMHAEAQYAVRALKAGAAGYLTKGTSTSELQEAIHRAAGVGGPSRQASPRP